MSAVFADTFYFIALTSRADEAHARCVEFSRQHRGKILTTSWVLVEMADALGALSRRVGAAALLREVRCNPQFQVVPLSETLLERGIEFYTQHRDKEWSLTDCISFIVMRDEGLSEALTGDHHFEQAGFKALLK